HGVGWLGACLDRWKAAGARRLLDFRELAGITGCILSAENDVSGARLLCAGEDAPAFVRPHAIGVRWPGERQPPRVAVRLDGRERSIAVAQLASGLGRVMLPGPDGDAIGTRSTS